MDSYTEAAMHRTMKMQEVILRMMAKAHYLVASGGQRLVDTGGGSYARTRVTQG
jgi:hypothetical protein